MSEFCLGTMTFHDSNGIWTEFGQTSQDDIDAILKAAFDHGVNFVDTADVYSQGGSERLLGKAIGNTGLPRDELVIATKAFGRTGPGPNSRGASRLHILNACDASLKRLQIEYIDLYQLHGFDTETPLEEQLNALDLLVRSGRVRYVGLSNWASWQLMKASCVSKSLNIAKPVSMQSYYSLAARELEREIIPAMMSESISLLVWSPLAGGYLSGKYSADAAGRPGRRRVFDFPPINKTRADRIVIELDNIAEQVGCSTAQAALSWLLHQKAVTSVIVGVRTKEQLLENINSSLFKLSEEQLGNLGAASKIKSEYPEWMFELQKQEI